MADEEDTKEIVHLPLVPVGTVEDACDTGHGRSLIGVSLDANSGIVPDTEEVVDNLESLVAGGEIDGGNIADLGELGGSVVYGSD